MGASLTASMATLFTSPMSFFRQPAFLLIWAVYLATYLAANCTRTTCERLNVDEAIPKFVVVTIVNTLACVGKDVVFAKMFGASGKAAVPFVTYALFALRDTLTMLASFNVPSMVANLLTEKGILKPGGAAAAAQLLCPVGMQIFSTPIHLLGLNLYNRPGIGFVDRLVDIKNQYKGACGGRMGRILPAFGFGGIGNNAIRDSLRAKVKAA